MVQQAQSFTERRHLKASLVHISSTGGAPEGHYASSMLRADNDTTMRRWEPSPTRSHYVENHNARLAQGAKHLGLDLAGKDLLYNGDSDPDNHG